MMATVQRITYGRGGFDPTKPGNNVADTGADAAPDLPAGVPAALVVLRNKVTSQGAQPTDAQLLSALSLIVARLVVQPYIDG